jgi:integrase
MIRAQVQVTAICEDATEAERFRRIVRSAALAAKQRWREGMRSCPTIAELAPEFMRYQRAVAGNKPSTLAAHKRRIEAFSLAWGDRPIDQITRSDVVRWAEQRLRAKGKAGRHKEQSTLDRGYVQQDLRSLRRLVRWGQEHGHLPANIECAVVPRLSVARRICGGSRHAPQAIVIDRLFEILARLRKRAPTVERVLRGMFLTGARPGALLELRWRDVQMSDSGDGSLALRGKKGGADGCIAVRRGGALCGLLQECASQGRRGWNRPVFLTARGKRWAGKAFQHAVSRACRAEGIERFTAYVVRHSAMTWLHCTPGVSAAAAQRYARHTRLTTQDCYSHAAGVAGSEAFEAVENALGKSEVSASGGMHHQTQKVLRKCMT